jgi:hypothetical protein
MNMSYACTTDYARLYSSGYYGHDQGVTSFSRNTIPPIVAAMAKKHGSKVLDIGGGNEALADALAAIGVTTFTVDAASRTGPRYQQLDLTSCDRPQLSRVCARVTESIGSKYLSTCFDVAEHIDIEHLPSFLFALSSLTPGECLFSVSTRPSSAANRYHASVLPILTWKRMLRIVGFHVEEHAHLQAGRSEHRFYGDEQQLIAVSHWQRLDPFREGHTSHQYYLHLRREAPTPSYDLIANYITQLLDLGYREEKRSSLALVEPPPLLYYINFIQDWSFFRSLIDVWPRAKTFAVIRRDLIAAPYFDMISSHLTRTGIQHAAIQTVEEGSSFLDRCADSLAGGLAVTATEGLLYPSHIMGSWIMLEARRRGLMTVCLQHGMNLPRTLCPASRVMAAWDTGSYQELRNLLCGRAFIQASCTGSPKFLDALLPSSGAQAQARLGVSETAFDTVLLVGLGLHWYIHQNSTDATVSWLQRLSDRNPRVLFIVRPHPDDSSMYGNFDVLQRHNILLADELLLLSLDLAASRLLHAVDGVITTYSTLMIDAVAAGKPVVLLPWTPGSGPDDPAFIRVSLPRLSNGKLYSSLSQEDWNRGTLPETLTSSSSHWGSECEHLKWFEPSLRSLYALATIRYADSPTQLSEATDAVKQQTAHAFRTLNFDKHPNGPKNSVVAALSSLLAAPR